MKSKATYNLNTERTKYKLLDPAVAVLLGPQYSNIVRELVGNQQVGSPGQGGSEYGQLFQGSGGDGRSEDASREGRRDLHQKPFRPFK